MGHRSRSYTGRCVKHSSVDFDLDGIARSIVVTPVTCVCLSQLNADGCFDHESCCTLREGLQSRDDDAAHAYVSLSSSCGNICITDTPVAQSTSDRVVKTSIKEDVVTRRLRIQTSLGHCCLSCLLVVKCGSCSCSDKAHAHATRQHRRRE